MVQIYIKIPVFMVILGYIYFESMLFFLSFVRKRNCIMIERMETCQNNRSDGNELPSGPGAVLTQSRFLFFLCLWEILLYKLKTLNLRFSEIFVNTHTHTIQARYVTNYFLNIKELAVCSLPKYLSFTIIFHLLHSVLVRTGQQGHIRLPQVSPCSGGLWQADYHFFSAIK